MGCDRRQTRRKRTTNYAVQMPKRAPIVKSAEFEKLTATIITELEPTATVLWDDHIVGKLSGRKRQIDVSIRRCDPEFLGIVDAKHYKRRATIDRIDALTGLMRDVEANYGALVCSGGFSKTIYEYARKTGVSLLNVHDAESVDWKLELSIPILWTELTPIASLCGEIALLKGDTIVTDEHYGFQVTADGGKTRLKPLSAFERYWNGPDASRTVGVINRITHGEAVKAIVTGEAGVSQLRAVRNYGFEYFVEARTWLGYFTPSECRGLVDYLDDNAFHASHLPVEQLPIQRHSDWQYLASPERLAVLPHGSIIARVSSAIISDMRLEDFGARYLGPLPDTETRAG